MANRGLLKIGKLGDFEKWLIADGWSIEDPKGSYEVLRARKNGRKSPLIVFRREPTLENNMEHYTICDSDIGVVRRFLRERDFRDRIASGFVAVEDK